MRCARECLDCVDGVIVVVRSAGGDGPFGIGRPRLEGNDAGFGMSVEDIDGGIGR